MLLPRNVSKLHWQRKFFSMSSWSNKAPFCYICIPTNSVHILNFVMRIMEVCSLFSNCLQLACNWLTPFFQMKLTLSSSTDNKPTISFQCHFFIHSKPQCDVLKSCTQSVHLLCQTSSSEGVHSFLFCFQPLYPHGYRKILFLERKMIIIHVVNSGDKCLHITP